MHTSSVADGVNSSTVVLRSVLGRTASPTISATGLPAAVDVTGLVRKKGCGEPGGSGAWAAGSTRVTIWFGVNRFSSWVKRPPSVMRSEEHTSELQSLMRSSYDVFCLKKKINITQTHST